MNKKEAIAYAQVALSHMKNSKYCDKINEDLLAIEMKQCFKLYPRNLIITIATAQAEARRKLENIKNGSDVCE